MTDADSGVGYRPRRVATYRAYRLDKAAPNVEAPRVLVFEAPDDATAIVRARALIGDDEFELREASRQVALATLVPGDFNE